MTGTTDTRPDWRRFRSWPPALRYTAFGLTALVMVVAGLAVVVGALVTRPLPQTDGAVGLPGLDAEVEVLRDEHGIPQIYADTTDDLMRAQGYVHAQERFFEMDVRRHATAGRLAEILGEDAVESDAVVRTMGWRRIAERELAMLRPDTRAALTAYADGVNAYVEGHRPSEIAVEYTVLGLTGLDYQPEEWTPVDSLAWLKAMAWDLASNMTDEIDRALLRDHWGTTAVTDLHPGYDYRRHRPIVGQGLVVDGVFEQDATTGGTRNPQRPPFVLPGSRRRGHGEADEFSAALRGVRAATEQVPELLGRGDGIGSNSWVVSGDRTETGEPLLANDPHLGVSLPGVWMQVGLHCREVSDACPLDVAGFSFSGVPGVIIGHNADIAWGFTNLYADVTDLYVERTRGGDEWFHGGEWKPMPVRRETIVVAGGRDVTITVRETDHGPILSDVHDQLADVAGAQPGPPPGNENEVSLAWTALEPTTTADAVLMLNAAGDWDEFREAAAAFDVPAQNMVYADREGHIGYQAPGRVPIRKSGHDGRAPVAGWLPENDWTGEYVPFEGLPSVLDPDEGFVVTANQAVADRRYPYLLTRDFDFGYRSQRIREALMADDEVSVSDMLDLQLESRHPLAERLTPYLLDVRLPGGYWSSGQQLLRTWDGEQGADSAAAAYFNVVWRRLLARTFHDELPVVLRPDGDDRWVAVIERLLDEPDSHWWDDVTTEEDEKRDDVLAAAMRDARDELTSRISPIVDEWRWGDLHQLQLESLTLGRSGNALAERLVNRGGWDVAGGPAAVNATAWDAGLGYDVTAAPSMRMVVDLADLDRSRWISLTGVSGHPLSDHYTDQTDLWARGETLPWAFSTDAVQDSAEETLVLEPAAD